MLHEIAHSTGHKDRLNRDMKVRFGGERYGKEELVAELSAAIVGQQYGVSKTILEGNAHYLHNWLGAIKQEPEFLNEVLEDVLNASNMIVDRVEEIRQKTVEFNSAQDVTKEILRDIAGKEIDSSRITLVQSQDSEWHFDLLIDKKESGLYVFYDPQALPHENPYSIGRNELGFSHPHVNELDDYLLELRGRNEVKNIAFYDPEGGIMAQTLSGYIKVESIMLQEHPEFFKAINAIEEAELIASLSLNSSPLVSKSKTQGKSAYELQAQYSRINGEYPFSATTDREKQVVHRIKQAESIIKVYNANISDYLGENYYQDKEKVYQIIPKEIYTKPRVMEKTIEQREYGTEQQSSEIKEPTINYGAVPVVEVYSDERLMTTVSVSQRNLSLPSDIISSIEDREQVLKDLEVTYSPGQEKELLEKKMRLEDDIRSRIRTYLAANYLLNLSPGITYNEKMKSLEQIKDYVAHDASEQRILHDGLNDKLPVVVTIDNTEENRDRLEDNYIEYEILPSNKLKYKGIARLQEGYALENTPANVAFLEDNGISYSHIKGRKLFVSLRAQKIALLLSSTALISPVIGLAVMYTMNKLHILDKLLENKQFSKEEAEKLNQGATLRKETVENGRKVEKYYFVDSDTNKLRSIPVHEVQLPHRVNGVELSVKELDDLRNGRTVLGFNEASGKYYEAKLNLNNKKAIDMGFKDLKAEKEFKYVPKPNSPDAEKIAYVQVHGAQGVNDIWEMGGVNLERDSFLDKYDVEGFYKDYLSANQDKDQARAKEFSESIQNNVSRQESLGISR